MTTRTESKHSVKRTQPRANREATQMSALRLVVSLALVSSSAPVFSQPDTPAGRPLAFPGSDSTSLDVSWVAPAGTVTSYDLRYQEDPTADPTSWELVEGLTGISTSITGLTADTAYWIGVRATNADGNSGWTVHGRGYTNAAELVSNTGQTSAAAAASVDASVRLATSFTTGVGLWELAYFKLDMQQWPAGDGLWIQVLDSLDSGEPGFAIVSNVVHPTRGTGVVTFTTPYPVELAGQTTYYISILAFGTTNEYQLGVTTEDGEDPGAAAGWSIADKGRKYENFVWSEVDSTLKMSILAIVKEPPNNVPVFTNPSPTISVAENTAADVDIGSPVAATDMDTADMLTYTLEGASALSFDIDSATGQLKTSAPLDYEAGPQQYTVTVRVSDGEDSATTAATINVSDVDEAPSAPGAPAIDNTSGPTTSLNVMWAAPLNTGPPITGYGLQYKKTTDTAWTSFTGTVDTGTRSATLSGLDNGTSYDVQVNATSNEGTSAWSPSGTATTRPSTAPAFSDLRYTRSVEENTAGGGNVGAPVSATASDPSLVSYALDGEDGGSFDVVTSSGQIQTKTGVSYDYEAKSSYSVRITASDGTDSATALVTIDLTDATEVPSAPAAPAVSPVGGSNTRLVVTWAAPVDDGRPPVTGHGLQYRKSGEASWIDFTGNIGGSTSSPDVDLDALDAGALYEVQVRAENSDGFGDWSASGQGTTTSGPLFSSDFATRSVAENTAAGIPVGAPVQAQDPDPSDTIAYSLEGQGAAFFGVDTSSGQILTSADLDHEADGTYMVTVKAAAQGDFDTIEVTINVEDVDEPPSAPDVPTVEAVVGSASELSVSWLAPSDVGRPPITSYDLQYRKGTAGTWLNGPQDVTGALRRIGNLDEDSLYEVAVRASNAEGDGPFSSPGQGRTNSSAGLPEAPTISVFPGDRSLTVSWSSPSGATNESTYDLWYILESADELDDGNWSKLTDVTAGGGPQYSILPRELANGSLYEVKVRHRQGGDTSPWSPVVSDTASDPGDGAGTAVSLAKGTPAGGLLAAGTDVDVFSFSGSALSTVCYVKVQDGAFRVEVSTSPEVGSRYVAGGTELVRLVLDQTGPYSLTVKPVHSLTADLPFEILCRDTPQASRSSAFEVDRNFPSDARYEALGDSYFFKFRVTAPEFVSVRTAGFLDTVVVLTDSDGNEVGRSDDGWHLGNVTNALIPQMAVGPYTGSTEPGVYYAEVSFPYTRTAHDDQRNIPLYIESVTRGGGDSAVAADPIDLSGFLHYQRGRVYFDAEEIEFQHGELSEAAAEDYWTFEAASRDGYEHLVLRGTAASGSDLTAVVLDGSQQPVDVYLRTETVSGGRYGIRAVDAFTVTGRFVSGRYFVKVMSSDPNVVAGPYTLTAGTDLELRDLELDAASAPGCANTKPAYVSDSYFPCQWHLSRDGPASIGVQQAWEAGYSGAGIEVAIVDSGYDAEHVDLVDNVDAAKNHSFVDHGTDPFHTTDRHGTAVAGVIGGVGNGIGIRGVAYNSTIYGSNPLRVYSDAVEADAITRDVATRGVSIHAYGLPDDGRLHRSAPTWRLAVDHSVKQGFGGLGSPYMVAAGNGGDYDDETTTLDEHNSHMGVIPVCGVRSSGIRAYDSEPGWNLWVCGPSPGIVTTSQYGRYTASFSGTSAPTPAVGGVAALIRQANPNLSWRDVKLVLAGSARKVDTSSGGWQQRSQKYGATGNYEFSRQYGFGLVDAEAAVGLATGGWTPVPSLLMDSACEESDLDLARDASAFTRRTLALSASDIEFVEYLEINVDLTAQSVANVALFVGSPDAMVGGADGWSELLPRRFVNVGGLDGTFRFSSNLYLGEAATGDWKLAVRNSGPEPVTLHSWEVVVYGHGSSSTPASGSGDSEVLDSGRRAGCSRQPSTPPPPPPGGGGSGDGGSGGGGSGDDEPGDDEPGDDEPGDDEPEPEPASCERHVTPYWRGTGGFVGRPANGRSANVSITCWDSVEATTATYDLFAGSDGLIVQLLRRPFCVQDGQPLMGRVEFTGLEDGGWYWVEGDRNVAVAPLVCESSLKGVVPTVPGGVEADRGDSGTLLIHEATGLMGIVPHLIDLEGDAEHVTPYWSGRGGVVGRPVNGTDASLRVICGDETGTYTHESTLEAGDDGVIAELVGFDQICFNTEGEPLSGVLHLDGLEDGGWYWINGERNAAVGPLVGRDSSTGREPVAPGGVSAHPGPGGTLFIHRRLMGIVPRLLKEEEQGDY